MEPTQLGYRRIEKEEHMGPGSDSYAIRVEGVIAVTPLSLDLTSRIELANLEKILKDEAEG